MPKKKWKHKKIKAFEANIFSGGTPSTTDNTYWGGSFNWLSSGETRSMYIYDTEKKITQKAIDASSTKLAKKGTIVIASAGQGKTRGQVSYCLIDTYINQSLIGIKVDESIIDSKFLFYKLTSMYNTLRQLSDSSSSRGSLTIPIIEDVDIEYPPIEEQRKISSLLYKYDSLINDNYKRIKVLEEVAQKLYKEWFIDFKFPGCKNGSMKNSEFGKIPKNWTVSKLGSIVDNIIETTEPGEHLNKLKYIPIDCIPRKSFILQQSEDYREAQSSLTLFKTYDILFGAMRPYFHKVVIAPFNGVTRKTCFVLRPKKPEYLSYAYLTIYQDSAIQYATTHSKGATIPYTFWERGMENMPILMPSEKVLTEFYKIIHPILEYVVLFYSIQNNLKQTRDMLLSKLISGEVDIDKIRIE